MGCQVKQRDLGGSMNSRMIIGVLALLLLGCSDSVATVTSLEEGNLHPSEDRRGSLL